MPELNERLQTALGAGYPVERELAALFVRGQIHRLRGQLHAAERDAEQGMELMERAEYYGRFANLWQDADPELQPPVREVKQRMARLAQEPSP